MEMFKNMNFFIHTRDLDKYDIIKPSAILEFFQDIAGIHADELGIGYETCKQKNLAWVVLYQRFEIVKIPPSLTNVNVKTWPKPKERLEFQREYLIEDLDGQTLVKGISNWVVIDLVSRNLVRTDKIDFNGEYYNYTNYNQKSKRKLSLDDKLIENYFTYKVQYDDLDHNGHMNNAKYLNIVYNNLGDIKSYVKNLEIAYIKEAKIDDCLKIGMYKVESQYFYIGFLNDEKCFECIIGVEKI